MAYVIHVCILLYLDSLFAQGEMLVLGGYWAISDCALDILILYVVTIHVR